MSDELHAQGPAWRQPRQGSEQDLRRMLLMAGGLASVLAVGFSGWSVLGHRHGGVPVIEAPSGPVRVRPDNPGGMQVSGLTDPAMVGDGSSGGTLAPPPETPDPQRLRAQVQAGQAPPSAAPSVTGPSVTASTGPVAPSPVSPSMPAVVAADRPATAIPSEGASSPSPSAPLARLATPAAVPAPPPARLVSRAEAPVAARAEAPVSRPGAAAPAPVVAASVAAPPVLAAAPQAAAQAGAVQVQLAAMDSQSGATTEWDRLSRRMPELLEGRHPDVQQVERDGRTLYRVRLGGFADMAQAIGFCAKVRAKGGGCSIAAF